MELMLEREQDQVAAPSPDDGAVLVDQRQHRAQVVRRLLSCGISADTLVQLLPEWSELIVCIDHEPGTDDPARRQPRELP